MSLTLLILSEILFKIPKTCSCSETRRSKVEEAEGRRAEVERKEKKGSATPRTERRCQLPRAEKAAANRALAELRTPRKSRSRSGDNPRNLARAGGGLAPSLASCWPIMASCGDPKSGPFFGVHVWAFILA